MKTALRALMLGGFAAAALAFAGCSKAPSAAAIGEEMTLGEAKAPVTIIEYASVTCAHCAEFHKDVMSQLMSKYVATGKVRIVYREFLTPPHDVAAAGTLTARCAGKDKYFKVTDAIMRAQPEMFAGGSTENARPVLQRIAKEVGGLSADQFAKCVTDPESLAALQANVEKFREQDKITGTPTFFINGKQLHRTSGDIGDFDRALAPLLAGK